MRKEIPDIGEGEVVGREKSSLIGRDEGCRPGRSGSSPARLNASRLYPRIGFEALNGTGSVRGSPPRLGPLGQRRDAGRHFHEFGRLLPRRYRPHYRTATIDLSLITPRDKQFEQSVHPVVRQLSVTDVYNIYPRITRRDRKPVPDAPRRLLIGHASRGSLSGVLTLSTRDFYTDRSLIHKGRSNGSSVSTMRHYTVFTVDWYSSIK